MLEKLINASFGQASREEWAQYRPEVAEIFPRTRAARRKAHRLGNADNCIPPKSHSWWKSSVHGGNGVAGCGGRIPAEINSERRGIQRLSRRLRNRFRAIISATLQNDHAPPLSYSPLLTEHHVFRLSCTTFLRDYQPFLSVFGSVSTFTFFRNAYLLRKFSTRVS